MAWVPLSAISQDREGDTYEFRSSMCSALCINWDHSGDGPRERHPDDFPSAWAKAVLDSTTRFALLLRCLLPAHKLLTEADVWMAYQPIGRCRHGLVVALVGREPYKPARLRLHAWTPKPPTASPISIPTNMTSTGTS
jgi:hypothetical protein